MCRYTCMFKICILTELNFLCNCKHIIDMHWTCAWLFFKRSHVCKVTRYIQVWILLFLQPSFESVHHNCWQQLSVEGSNAGQRGQFLTVTLSRTCKMGFIKRSHALPAVCDTLTMRVCDTFTEHTFLKFEITSGKRDQWTRAVITQRVVMFHVV